MRSARLLLAVPAATALVFTGMSPAWAGDDRGHHDDNDVEIVDILRVEIDEHDDDKARVYFTYKCDDDADDLQAEATVTQERRGEDSKYETDGKQDVKDCDKGDTEEDSVLVKKEDGPDLDEDRDAKVTVTLYEDGDEVDEKTDDDVNVVEEDGDGDHDKDHHDY
jgi:hypothetical protein